MDIIKRNALESLARLNESILIYTQRGYEPDPELVKAHEAVLAYVKALCLDDQNTGRAKEEEASLRHPAYDGPMGIFEE